MTKRWLDHPARKALREHLNAYPPETDDERAERIERIWRAVMTEIDRLHDEQSCAPEVPCLPSKSTDESSPELPSYLSRGAELDWLPTPSWATRPSPAPVQRMGRVRRALRRLLGR